MTNKISDTRRNVACPFWAKQSLDTPEATDAIKVTSSTGPDSGKPHSMTNTKGCIDYRALEKNKPLVL